MMHRWYPGYGPGGNYMWIGTVIGGLFFLTLFALALVVLIRLLRRGGSGMHYVPPRGSTMDQAGAGGSDALRILDERLARGDISVEDYHARRAALTAPPNES